ncbi:MAG: hypothetical protein GTO46_12985 [Gemmatimonadetes bacterium]|nr:hypothetical protein [Gemmatimonadota bacterium]NIO32497.1 hypothetical protein [Gemmatimonadota bacterium]
MKRPLLCAAAIAILIGSASATVAQTDPDLAEVQLGAFAALTLAENWQDWRQDGPDNAGVCLLGNVETDGRGIQVSTITSAVRVARLSGCSNERTIGAAILAPTGLFDHDQLEELACAAVRAHDDWLVFGIITGTERRILSSGEVMFVAQGLWCTIVHDQAPLLAGLPAGVP